MLLSIAIPTYNRSNILIQSLISILPEIEANRNDVELILSDNFSEDNTFDLIEDIRDDNRHLRIVINRQSENTGYYGNFRKCRELSTAEYFWLLSDNEIIVSGIISIVIEILKHQKDLSFIHLRNDPFGLIKDGVYYRYSNVVEFLQFEDAYKVTLISSVIIKNLKSNDDYIFSRFYKNAFLGFLFLIEAMASKGDVVEIYGKVFSTIPAKVSFDVFEVWTKDITLCLYYLKGRVNLDISIINKFINEYLLKVLYQHIYQFRLRRQIQNRTDRKILSIRKQVENYYKDYENYHKYLKPILYKPLYILYSNHFIKKVRNKICKSFVNKSTL